MKSFRVRTGGALTQGAVVKFIHIGEDMIALLSANPSYPPEAVRDPEAIIGRVIWMGQAV